MDVHQASQQSRRWLGIGRIATEDCRNVQTIRLDIPAEFRLQDFRQAWVLGVDRKEEGLECFWMEGDLESHWFP